MGIIRKTLSISTLGIVDFRSKKELLRRAEKAQRAAEHELAQVKKVATVIDGRLAEAERRARAAELVALKEAKRSEKERGRRRARRRAQAEAARARVEEVVANAQPVVEREAQELGRRGRKAAAQAAQRARRAQGEARELGRRGRKRAAKVARRAEKAARRAAS